ncbi:MAG: GTPase HflX [Deltaproteobacteria bacterium RBG_16_71_12]|nr:MAG: GTPase HflX [Deltaproteobacteria bacterium RBG_16_71_12]
MDANRAPPRAVLVGVQLPDVTAAEHEAGLAELSRLVDTLGFQVVATVSQKRTSLAPAAGLGGGKLAELSHITGGSGVIESGAKKRVQKKELHKPAAEPVEDDVDDTGAEVDGGGAAGPSVRADVVVVDNELSPSQLRNLEKATGVEVLDRAGVIIEIFWRHARTKEAQLQVEIARLHYEAPRLREKEHTGDRQRGGGVGGKGDDELELDRRRVRDRIAELKRELSHHKTDDATRRARRKDATRVALVGYTNAGKSSLMRALTGSEVLIADKLFATLGTTVRALHPETRPRILISDTVGFIKNLPHGLVASFRTTLEEANEASLLLYVVDAADPACRTQLEVTKSVLAEIEADRIPSLLVLNKVDRLSDLEKKRLARDFPRAVLLSALSPADVKRLRELIVEHFEHGMEETTLLVPFSRQGVLGSVREHARVVKEDWDEEGARLLVRAPKEHLDKLRALLV